MSISVVSPPTVVFLAGRDPTEEIGGGHASYVRATARAAVTAGFAPQIYCVSPQSGNELLDYGLVRRVAHRGHACRQTRVSFHAPALIAAALEDAARTGPPALIHSFGVWGYVGHVLQARWRVAGASIPHLLSMYTVYEEESRALLRASWAYGFGRYLRQWLEWQWIRTQVTPLEREAVLGADAVLVNYESVRALVDGRYGVGHKVQRIGYGPESAFLPEAGIPPPPATLARWQEARLPLVVTIALQRPKKGVDRLLRALSLVNESGIGFRVCVVGGGPPNL